MKLNPRDERIYVEIEKKQKSFKNRSKRETESWEDNIKILGEILEREEQEKIVRREKSWRSEYWMENINIFIKIKFKW